MNICNALSELQLKQLDYTKYTKVIQNKTYFLHHMDEIQSLYTRFLHNMKKYDISFFTSIHSNIHIPHPLSFECGHVIHFICFHFLGNIKKYRHYRYSTNVRTSTKNIFDSLQNEPQERETNYSFSIETQMEYMKTTLDIVRKEIIDYPNEILHHIDCYILELCILHFEMHKEVIFFIHNQQHIYHTISIFKNTHIDYTNVSKNKLYNPWVYIDCKKESNSSFMYGFDIDKDIFIFPNKIFWDNERPKIETKIENFYFSTYPITYGEYIEFVENDGYENNLYWSFKGWNWLLNYKLKHPINIYYDETNETWMRKHFNKTLELDYDLPVVHISYYEAEAYAKYRKARLPTEAEFNYLLTNGGKTLYPWGNDTHTSLYCNSNYQNDDVVKVNHEDFIQGKNKWNIYGLFGNCWYWTSTPFYPFDGFTIDPIYDTFSYPFFYFRNVVKGSSWCVKDTLFHSYYRNAQEKEKCFHFTGMFLVKDDI